MNNFKKSDGYGKVGGGISPVTAALAGAIAGAGVAIAGAVALSKQSNRDKITKVVEDVKRKATKFAKKAKRGAMSGLDKIEDKKDEVVGSVDKAVKVARKTLDGKVDEISKNTKRVWQK